MSLVGSILIRFRPCPASAGPFFLETLGAALVPLVALLNAPGPSWYPQNLHLPLRTPLLWAPGTKGRLAGWGNTAGRPFPSPVLAGLYAGEPRPNPLRGSSFLGLASAAHGPNLFSRKG